LGENQLEEAVVATMILRELGVGRIISRAGSDLQGRVLERLGVSKVVFPERQVGNQIARQILSPTLHEMIPISDGTSFAELEITETLNGRSIGEAAIRSSHRLNVVAVRRARQVVRDDGSVDRGFVVDNMPGPETRLAKGDVLIVVGRDEDIRGLAGRT